MRNLLFLLSFITVLTSLSCTSCQKTAPPSDNTYGLPNATQTGENMFACRVNDSNWIVIPGIHSYLGTTFSKSNFRDTFSVGAHGSSNELLDLISFTVKSKIQQGVTYRLNDTSRAFVRTFRLFSICGPTSGYGGAQWNYGIDGFITVTKFGGTYTVPSCCASGTYDPDAILSGTFNFVIAIPNCDSIKVTDGRFDINYSNY